jgi:hypothetical protein
MMVSNPQWAQRRLRSAPTSTPGWCARAARASSIWRR